MTKQLLAFVQLGDLTHDVSYVAEDGTMSHLVSIPIDNMPETLAYYAHDKKVDNIVIYGFKKYTTMLKDKVISKSLKEYGHSNLLIELKEF